MGLMHDMKKMHPGMKVLLVVAVVLLLWGLFWPRQRTYVKIVPVSAEKFYGGYEHMDGGDDQGVKEAMASGQPCMTMFYAPWCGYCKKVMPEWDRLAASYRKCKVLKVNCDVHKELGKRHGVKSYPTIKFLPKGLGNPAGGKEYQGARTMADFAKFVDQCISADPSVMPNQAAALTPNVPPYRAGQGPLTTSFVARNFGLE
jgi:protein disulfide-isomerase-like protein